MHTEYKTISRPVFDKNQHMNDNIGATPERSLEGGEDTLLPKRLKSEVDPQVEAALLDVSQNLTSDNPTKPTTDEGIKNMHIHYYGCFVQPKDEGIDEGIKWIQRMQMDIQI